MDKVLALGVTKPNGKLELIEIPRRSIGESDVKIDIDYCGICHSDLHHCRGDWSDVPLPAVPGHEIIGHVESIGRSVSRIHVGDRVAVGCFQGSCGSCKQCTAREPLIQYCSAGLVQTYGSKVNDGTDHTYGGYSQSIVVDQEFVLLVPDRLDSIGAAPLLCAGITTYSPMKYYGVKAGSRVAIAGLGGLGHVAVKIASAMGAHVTALTHSDDKVEDAIHLGANDVQNTSRDGWIDHIRQTYDFVIDTLSCQHSIDDYLDLLGVDGTLIVLGAPPQPLSFTAMPLLFRRLKIGGSLVGNIAETEEMLAFCAKHSIVCETELISAADVNTSWDRLDKGDVRFRFVIDIGNTLTKGVVLH
jgi:uncharacterized zinc-type alcohol dehydrogenase-like protein